MDRTIYGVLAFSFLLVSVFTPEGSCGFAEGELKAAWVLAALGFMFASTNR